MITNYSINEQNILCFYFDFSYELAGNLKEETFLSKILNYIKDNGIKYNGNKILLIASGIIIGTMLFNSENIAFNYDGTITKMILENNQQEVLKENKILTEAVDNIQTEKQFIEETTSNKTIEITDNKVQTNTIADKVIELTDNSSKIDDSLEREISKNEETINIVEKTYKNPVTIHRKNGEILTMELEEYLIGVVGAEMPASFNIEALKAQSVASRTYALKSIKEGKLLTDNERTQSYNDNSQLQDKWGSEYQKYYNKVKEAVNATSGIYMAYDNNYIDAVYHASNNGYTLSASDVWGYDIPYLKSVESSFDIGTTSYLRKIDKDIETIKKILSVQIENDEDFIINRDITGHVTTVSVNGRLFSGIEFRNLLGLRSTDFDIQINGNNLIITTRGYGHGVGMSQYGANAMANSGYSYKDILNHYYTNIKILP